MPAFRLSRLMRRPRVRITRRRLIAGATALVILAGSVAWAAWPTPPSYTTAEAMLTVLSGPRRDEPVRLDTTLFLPRSASATDPVPAILLAHGFGGTKRSVADDARDFADRGYAVLTWTARGFGRSGGQIHLNSPDYEIHDGRALVDWLAGRPEIAKDASNDPKVGVVGGSYGGALALMLAGQDSRVDAIVPMITWNDLARSFLPNGTGGDPLAGVFKKQWAGIFFGAGGRGDASGLADLLTGGVTIPTDLADQLAGITDPECGRFAREVCDAYLALATTGRADDATVALLRRSSPSSYLDGIRAPTLLIQGQADSLFPLGEAVANYNGIASRGTPVRVDWFTGGHDGGSGPLSDQNRLRFLTTPG
jgi:ABC-2 type transport system ATP-binding protein